MFRFGLDIKVHLFRVSIQGLEKIKLKIEEK